MYIKGLNNKTFLEKIKKPNSIYLIHVIHSEGTWNDLQAGPKKRLNCRNFVKGILAIWIVTHSKDKIPKMYVMYF